MKISSLCLSLFFLAQAVHATPWNILGPRAMGMGGAGVAMSQGAVGEYWNPAGLGQVENPWGVQIPVSVHGTMSGNILLGINDATKIKDDCSTIPVGPNCTSDKILNVLNELGSPKTGTMIDAGVGADLKFGRLAVFVNDFAYAAAVPNADMTHTTILDFKNNTSGISLHGISVTEFGVGYGHELPWVPGILVGGNLKLLVGRVGYSHISVFQSNSGNPFRDLTNNYAQSVQPGLDVGVLWDVNRTFENAWWRPRFGVTARNINDPDFAESSLGKGAGLASRYSLQSNARAGVAFSPLHFWNIAADMDLTRNVTPLGGLLSQEMGIGTEVNVFNRSWVNIPLRIGARRNIADTNAHTTVTGGFGLHFMHLNVDAAGMVTPNFQPTQSVGKTSNLPTDAGASVQVGFMFGGEAEEKAEPKPVAENIPELPKPEPTLGPIPTVPAANPAIAPAGAAMPTTTPVPPPAAMSSATSVPAPTPAPAGTPAPAPKPVH